MMMKKIFFVSFLFLIASIPIAKSQDIRRLAKDGYNVKFVTELPDGKQRYQFHIAHINYKDSQGNFKPIDTSLSFDNTAKKWKHNKASYIPELPEYADDWFEFYNAYEGANHTIKAKPIAEHVKGVAFDNSEGRGVIYTDAFGKGIDLKVYAYWGGLKKVIVINEKPTDVSQDLTFDFEMQFPTPNKDKIKDKDGNEWDKSTKLNFKDKTLKIGEEGKESYFRNAWLWDSKDIHQPVDIELYVFGGKTYLRKTITKDILEKAVYPLYTDHPTSYYAGAGDGMVGLFATSVISAQLAWDTSHDASTCEVVDYTSTDFIFGSIYTDLVESTYSASIDREFFPVNTSGIADDATITNATLNLFSEYGGSSDTSEYITVVQTTQASPTELVEGDYDQCGAINNPTEGVDSGNRIIINNIAASSYAVFTLNSTGIGWINKTGYTLLGVREGQDTRDALPPEVYYSEWDWSPSEYTGTEQDPYLDVTVSAGGAVDDSQLIMIM